MTPVQRINVLLVDDSLAVRALLRKALEGEPRIENIFTASNGRIAIDFMNEKKPDLLILDMNMPEKNGLQVISEMRGLNYNIPVVLFSTAGQAPETLKALQFNKVDFLAKDETSEGAFGSSLEENVKKLRLRLLPKMYQFFQFPSALVKVATAAEKTEPVPSLVKKHFMPLASFRPSAVVIACSTGGPRALEEIFKDLHLSLGPQKNFGPVFIVQHMPAGFTSQLAERLSKISGLKFKEAAQNEVVQSSTIYIAPGGSHMELRSDPDKSVKIIIHQKEQRHSVRPSADYIFETAAPIYKEKLLSLVLTGMGEDGIEGVPVVKKYLGKVITQTAATCAVYGMPRAVDEAGFSDGSESLEAIKKILIDLFFKS